MDGQPIKEVNSAKYLGVAIDQTPSWSKHASNIVISTKTFSSEISQCAHLVSKLPVINLHPAYPGIRSYNLVSHPTTNVTSLK